MATSKIRNSMPIWIRWDGGLIAQDIPDWIYLIDLRKPGVGKVYDLDGIVPFGVHRGKSVRSVLLSSPNYILWCLENLRNFRVADSVMILVAEHRSGK